MNKYLELISMMAANILLAFCAVFQTARLFYDWVDYTYTIPILILTITALMLTFPPSKTGVNTVDDWLIMAKNRFNFYIFANLLIILLLLVYNT